VISSEIEAYAEEATLKCSRCGKPKKISDYYTKGGQKPSCCKQCELEKKHTRRRAKRLEIKLVTQRTRSQRLTKVLEVCEFKMVDTYEHQDPNVAQEIIQSYIEKVAAEQTKLRKT
jgi:hypothetical protein